MQQIKQERSIGELFAELANETSTLVRQEVKLAKVEITQKAARVGRNVGFLAIGGAITYAAFLALMATAIVALAQIMAWWAATLIVGVLVGVIGSALMLKAISGLKETNLKPEQTVETLKEDAQWIKEQIK